MTKIDQFESLFRAAERELYTHEPVQMAEVLVITDRDPDGARVFGDEVRRFLKAIERDGTVQWRDVAGTEFGSAGELLDLVTSAGPDLVCTYRNLHSGAWRWPYGLGIYLDVLTQHTSVPVLVLPHPDADASSEHALQDTNVVMAITDHLTGDKRLVNFALQFLEPGGTLWLTHVEDEVTFERYMDAIAKIPSLDTDEARETLSRQLLKEPRNYIASCSEQLGGGKAAVTVEQIVTFGHHLFEYKKLIEEHQVDLLVMNTKDADQLAMHGLAHPLAVELRQIPLLML